MFDQIGEGVFRRRYRSLDLNVGVVIGDDAVLIVDTRASHVEADELRSELKQLTRLPVRWVVNTHWHWDHTFGNSRFPGAQIIGHENCRLVLSEHAEDVTAQAREWLPSERHLEIDEVEIVPPGTTFAHRASIDIGREIVLAYHGLAHTNSDIVVLVPDAGVGFLGDLVEEGAPPSFGDSYPVDWPLTLRLATQEMPDVVVPGHGDVVAPAFVRSQHEELVKVAEIATAFVTGEMNLDEAITSGPYPADVVRGALVRAREVSGSVN